MIYKNTNTATGGNHKFSYRIYSGFQTLSEIYAPLQSDTNQKFFSSFSWYKNYCNHIPDSNSLVKLVGNERSDYPSLLPIQRKFGSLGPFRYISLESLSNYYSPYYEPISRVDGERNSEFIRRALSRLTREEDWDQLKFSPLIKDSCFYQQLKSTLQGSNLYWQEYFCFENWHQPLLGMSYLEYYRNRPGKLRSTIERKGKKLNTFGATFEIYRGTQGLDVAVNAYQKVYAKSWKRPESHPEFITDLIHICAEKGALRLGIIWLEKEPIAVQLWIVHADTAYIYKLAYNQAYKRHSPGTLLTAYLMKHVIDVDRVQEVDFLTGDDRYKRDWMSCRRELCGLLVMNPATTKGKLLAARHFGGRFVREMATWGKNG